MGLREKKAERTRRQVVDVALDLFLQQGYDETTMEQIAERAEVGTTTLYRYFPSKDLLLLEPLVHVISAAPHVRARPADEPLPTVLRSALRSIAVSLDEPGNRVAEVRRLVDAAPVPRARLWDFYRSSREDLELALAERMGRAADDLSVRLTAGMVLELTHVVDERRRRDDYARSTVELLAEVLADLPDTLVVLPDPESSPAPGSDPSPSGAQTVAGT